MKKYMVVIALFMAGTAVMAQKPMASPAASTEGSIGGVSVKVSYHQPSAKGRKVMGELVPFGQVWRTGANNTTSIEFGAPVKVEGQALAQGKYGLYTIPGENEWVIIFNKDIKWGAFDYKEASDVLRVKVKPGKTDAFVETFTVSVSGDMVTLQWENTKVSFKVSKG